MDEEIETLVVRVRADTAGFARDIEAMRASLEGPLAHGAEKAGRRIENALLRAVRTGKLGFEDLGRMAEAVLADIAASAVRAGIASLGGQNAGGDLGAALAGLLGAPGRATGGPVSPGRAYRVGERGPELFVPTASGRVVTEGGAREVRVAITINAPAGEAPRALAQSSRQVARAVRAAIEGA